MIIAGCCGELLVGCEARIVWYASVFLTELRQNKSSVSGYKKVSRQRFFFSLARSMKCDAHVDPLTEDYQYDSDPCALREQYHTVVVGVRSRTMMSAQRCYAEVVQSMDMTKLHSGLRCFVIAIVSNGAVIYSGSASLL